MLATATASWWTASKSNPSKPGIWPEPPGLPQPRGDLHATRGRALPATGPRGANMGFFTHTKKTCLRLIFTSRPENRDRVSNSSLECCGLVIHAARSGFFFLGHLSHQCFCGKHQSGDRGGVLQRVPGPFRRVDYACFYQVDIL